ncbi:unnamed protein product [Closterium sp. NIES-54]
METGTATRQVFTGDQRKTGRWHATGDMGTCGSNRDDSSMARADQLDRVAKFSGVRQLRATVRPRHGAVHCPVDRLVEEGGRVHVGGERSSCLLGPQTYFVLATQLHIADPHRPFELVTDASDIDVGAVLLQDFRNGLQPIAYESRKLHPPKRNYPIHDREMLVIVHAFKVWRCYLTRADVTVRTDHRALQYLRAQPNLNPRQIRWLDYLESNFHYIVTNKKGALNIADALVRTL